MTTGDSMDETDQSSLAPDKKQPAMILKAFSPELAKFLNPKKPDITGALILAQLAKWYAFNLEPNARRAHSINGINATYMTVVQIQAELPWLSKQAIYKAVNRLKAFVTIEFKLDAVHCVFPDGFKEEYRLGKKNENEPRRGWIMFSVSDAVDHGVIQACILHNLNYQLTNWTNPVTDEEGNKYGSLIPAKMTLPFSRENMARAISDLANQKVIIKHPKRRSFYRFSKCDDSIPNCDDSRMNCDDSRMNCDDSRNTPSYNYKITTIKPPKLESVFLKGETATASPTPFCPPLPNSISNSVRTQTDDEFTLVNAESIRPINSVLPKPVGFCHHDSSLVTLAPEIMMQAKLKSAHYEQMRADGTLITAVDNNELPYDEIGDLTLALWQEGEVVIDPNTDKPFTRAAYINYTIKDLERHIQCCELPCTEQDLTALKQLFIDHPLLTKETVETMLAATKPEENILLIGDKDKPKSGYDDLYFARRIKTMPQFIKYFHQFYREVFIPVLMKENHNGKERIVFADGIIYDLLEVTELDCQMLFHDDKVYERHYKYYIEHGDDMSEQAIDALFNLQVEVQQDTCPQVHSMPACPDTQECPTIVHN